MRLAAAICETWHVTSNIGLYYPYTHFRDSAWLKMAALYWPKMARIMPHHFPLNDGAVTQALIDELDFVINLSPGSAAPEASQIFHDVLASHGRELGARHGLDPHFWRSAMDNPQAYSWWQFNRDDYTASRDLRQRVGIDQGMIIPGLLQTEEYSRSLLASAEIEKRNRRRNGGLAHTRMLRQLFLELAEHRLAAPVGNHWAAMSPDVAWVYMCVLTERLAQQNGLFPVTDQDDAYGASFEWTADRVAAALLGLEDNPAGGESTIAAIAFLALRVVIPTDLEDIPVSKIVHIRRRYAAEFEAFHDAVRNLADEVRHAVPPNADDQILTHQLEAHVDQHFRRPLRDVGRALKGVGIETTFAIGGLKFEVPAAAATGALLVKHPVVGATAGAAIALIGALRNHARLRNEKLSPSAVSYLWQVRKVADARSAIQRMLRNRKTGL